MASNIVITGSILNSSVISRYSPKDTRLLSSQNITENFGYSNDYIEYYVYDIGGNPLYINNQYKDYKLSSKYGATPGYVPPPNIDGSIENTQIGTVASFSTNSVTLPVIEIDPVLDLQKLGYSSGEFQVQYNFFTNKISDSSAGLFIKEISSDRTELRVGSTVLTNDQIESSVNDLINAATSSIYFIDYLLNFGRNTQATVVNIALNTANTASYEIFFKLYNPLSLDISEKTSLWVVEEKINPYIFNINLDKLIYPDPQQQLRGPNFDISIKDQGNVGTPYQNYNNLVSNQSSSYKQLLNLLTSQSIRINVDYSDFSNFIFFGSATARINNFYNKVKQIEDYNTLITAYSPSSSSISNLVIEINNATSSINNIISNFDRFESYLYFETSSIAVSTDYGINSYPKSSSLKPYILYSTSSLTASAWYSNALTTAGNYDEYNTNNLEYTVPFYITENSDNENYLTFLNMIGHYFDDIWVTLKAVTDINRANNNLDEGISRDLVYSVLQSLGISLHNSFGNQNLNQYLIGANTGSAFISGSSLTDFSATSSFLNNIPRQDLLAESYKRIYHNLPLLLKQKGTVAGLETLISIFGIPSRTYITGSAISSSILNVKEFGGSTKAGLLPGYNNNKVRVVTTTITGSLLSPFISVQIPSSESSKWLTADDHYVDVSFSPQTQIDAYISQSISSSNPSWLIDNYIGDPGQLYSSSYSDLDAQKNIYFAQGTGSYKGYTGSLMDYNGFIRLIQYFDNSLFKMLNEYVPARVNLSTGVTINSPVLERNKVAYASPENTTNQTVYNATYSIVSASAQYGTFYDNLSGNKSPFFTGELSGSIVDVNDYFEDVINPYLGDWDSYNGQHTITESINLNRFLHSDFNVLLNNVSQSVSSIYRNTIEYIYGTTGSIFTPSQLQDSYLSLTSYNRSRYEGIQVTSLEYNTYTSASDTYEGDKSFGKTAAIDHYNRKFGLFTQIETSSFLRSRNYVSLKYLIDESGSLTDLNQRNKHWEEIQRTFIAGHNTTIALFDNQKFATNQKFTDGLKPIFESGYSYDPVLYFDSCNGSSPKLYFSNLNGASSYQATANNNTSPYKISGSGVIDYPISSSYVNGIFNNIAEGSSYFSAGTYASPPSYSVQEGGDYKVSISVGISASISSSSNTITGSLQLWKNNSSIIASSSITLSLSTTSSAATGSAISGLALGDYFYKKSVSSVSKTSTVTSIKPIKLGSNNYPAGTSFYTWPLTGFSSGTLGLCGVGGLIVPSSTVYSIAAGTPTTINGASVDPSCSPLLYEYTAPVGFYTISDFNTANTVTASSATININRSGSSAISGLVVGDTLSIKLNISASNSNFTASLTQGSLSISSLAASTGYVSTTCPYFNIASINSGSSVITFSSGVSNFSNGNYIFVPNPLTGSASNLYSTYGNVSYAFDINPYDTIIVQLSDNSYIESRVLEVNTSGGLLQVTLDTVLSSLYASDLINGTYQKFLVLHRKEDETNMYLTYSKGPGQTSYGFIIPQDLAPDILDNIDTITKEIKQKLLSDQQGII